MHYPRLSPVLSQTVLIIVACIFLLMSCGGSDARQASYIERAQAHFDAGRIEKAGVDIRNALQINGDNAAARYLYALIHERQGNWQQMYANLKHASDLDATMFDAHVRLAGMYLANNEFENALDTLDNVLATDPNQADAHAVRAGVFAQMNKTHDAVESAQKALSLEPQHVYAIGVLTQMYKQTKPELALQFIQQGLAQQGEPELLKLLEIAVFEAHNRLDDAMRTYQEILAAVPTNLYFQFRYQQFLEANEKYAEAEQVIRSAVASHPQNVELKQWLLAFLERWQGIDAAAFAAEQFSAANSNPQLQISLAKLRAKQQRFDDAQAILQSLAPEGDTAQRAQLAREALLSLAIANGRTKQRDALVEQLILAEPENITALLVLAVQDVQAGNRKDAIARLRTAIRNDPMQAKSRVMLAQVLQQDGSHDLAKDTFQQALSLQPTNAIAQKALIRYALAEGNINIAANIAQVALQSHPQDNEAASLLVTSLVRSKRWEDARQVAAELRDSQATQLIGEYLLGRIYYAREEYEIASTSFFRVLQIEPSAVEALQLIVDIFLRSNQSDDAIAFLLEHLQAHPDHIHAMQALARVFGIREEFEAANSWAERAIAQNPKRDASYLVLGGLSLLQDDAESALEAIEQGLLRNGQSTSLLLEAARLSEAQGRFQQAANYYKDLLSRSNNAVAKNNLAMLFADHLPSVDNYNEALALMRGLVDTNVPAFVETLGWVYHRLGEQSRAEHYIVKAINDGLDDPTAHYHLALVYQAQGRRNEAFAALVVALESQEAFPERAEAELLRSRMNTNS